jgi:LemA protein
MFTAATTPFFLVGIVLLLIILVIIFYNQLVKARILTQEGFSGIGTYLQLRNDLVPSLVETVKGYAGHENKTLIEVVKWRNENMAATTVEDQDRTSRGLQQSLMNLVAISENYPQLKADSHFLELMKQLSEVEGKLNDSRRYYNATVREYNQGVETFPKNLVARSFGFKNAAFFSEEASARTVPQFDFQ